MTVKKKSILDRDHGHEEKARGVRDNAAERETEGDRGPERTKVDLCLVQGASRTEEGRCTIKGRTENRGFLSRREGNRSERFRVCSEVHGARVESREVSNRWHRRQKGRQHKLPAGTNVSTTAIRRSPVDKASGDTDTSTGECRVIFMYFVHSAW